MSLNTLQQLWRQFWFTPESAVPAAFARITFGLLLIQFVVLLAPELHPLLGEKSVLPRMIDNAWLGSPAFSLLDYLPHEDRYLDGLLGIMLLCAIGLTLGLCTRACALVILIIMSSFYATNAFVFGASDAILRTVMFLLVFSHAGDALSVKRLLSVWLSKRCPGSSVQLYKPWALRLIQVHFALVWWVGCTRKFHGADWMNGNAVYYVTHVNELVRYPLPFLPDNLWTSKFLTWSTMLLEFALAVLIWIEDFRLPLILLGTIFHLAMDWALWVPQFEFVMIAGLIAFLSPTTYSKFAYACRRWIRQLGAEPIKVEFNPRSDLSCRIAETVRRLDLFKLAQPEVDGRVEGATTESSGLTVYASGNRLTGTLAARALAQRLPLLMLLYPALLLPSAPPMIAACSRLLGKLYP
jgi:uncharacterized membrane protein YphA (DoxX/SURF4 family)